MKMQPLPDGTRVHHAGESYPRARRFGTATIVGHFYLGEHLEYQVLRDGAAEPTPWAYYHVRQIHPMT